MSGYNKQKLFKGSTRLEKQKHREFVKETKNDALMRGFGALNAFRLYGEVANMPKVTETKHLGQGRLRIDFVLHTYYERYNRLHDTYIPITISNSMKTMINSVIHVGDSIAVWGNIQSILCSPNAYIYFFAKNIKVIRKSPMAKSNVELKSEINYLLSSYRLDRYQDTERMVNPEIPSFEWDDSKIVDNDPPKKRGRKKKVKEDE